MHFRLIYWPHELWWKTRSRPPHIHPALCISLPTGSFEQPDDGPSAGPTHVAALIWCRVLTEYIYYIYIYIHTLYSLYYCHKKQGWRTLCWGCSYLMLLCFDWICIHIYIDIYRYIYRYIHYILCSIAIKQRGWRTLSWGRN
jgi:hypothetical protein